MRTTFATAVEKMLMSKRRVLLDKLFDGTITAEENEQLIVVREGVWLIRMERWSRHFDRLDRELAAVEHG